MGFLDKTLPRNVSLKPYFGTLFRSYWTSSLCNLLIITFNTYRTTYQIPSKSALWYTTKPSSGISAAFWPTSSGEQTGLIHRTALNIYAKPMSRHAYKGCTFTIHVQCTMYSCSLSSIYTLCSYLTFSDEWRHCCYFRCNINCSLHHVVECIRFALHLPRPCGLLFCLVDHDVVYRLVSIRRQSCLMSMRYVAHPLVHFVQPLWYPYYW